jgi:hypothetical protein
MRCCYRRMSAWRVLPSSPGGRSCRFFANKSRGPTRLHNWGRYCVLGVLLDHSEAGVCFGCDLGERVRGDVGGAAEARNSIDGSSADLSGRGATGQWPAGFPAYSTAADIVTDGSNSSLTSALNDSACSSGCVIEHSGDVDLTVSSRAGTGEIVVRPPIGPATIPS